jgi:hypothetical protein
MVQVYKTTTDPAGAIIGEGPLPMDFANRGEAVMFMQQYIALVFQHGRAGYQPAEACWWGCDETAELRLHRYRIDPLTDTATT